MEGIIQEYRSSREHMRSFITAASHGKQMRQSVTGPDHLMFCQPPLLPLTNLINANEKIRANNNTLSVFTLHNNEAEKCIYVCVYF